MKLAAAAQMKRMDETAIHGHGIPSTVLMERAAQGILQAVLELTAHTPGKTPRAAVFVGPGNNGGDGTAVAALLRRKGWQVRVFLAGAREKLTADHREMVQRLETLGGRLEDYDPANTDQRAFAQAADVIVDALFGVGLNSPLREPGLSAVELMNAAPAPVVAADIPSGIEADTGRVLGCAVSAAVTVTFSMAKIGLFVGKGALHAGRVIVHDIDIPPDISAQEDFPVEALTGDMVKDWLPPMPRDGHKGTFGKVYALAGSIGYTGAPVLATRAAARCGAGLVFLNVPEEIYPIIATRCDEVMPSPVPLPAQDAPLDSEVSAQIISQVRKCDAALLGPGLRETPAAAALLRDILAQTACPIVLDAGGLNLTAKHMDMLGAHSGALVLTPHDGEFARLGGDLSRGDRLGEAIAFARAHRCVLVLKGHNTIVAAPDGRAFINATGNPGMAKGGSGDVLSGMILALLGRGLDPFRAAAAGVYLHGLAGDLCAKHMGEWGMLPTDLIGEIPYAIQTVLN